MTTATWLDGLIIQSAELHSGHPVVDGTGVTVRAIAVMYKQGMTPEDIIAELPTNLAQTYAALTYYHLHTQEVEDDIQADSEAALIAQYGNTSQSVDA